MNIFKKIHICNQKSFPFLSRTSAHIIGIGLPVILIYLCALLLILLSTPELPGYVLAKKHFDFLEHIVMSATIVITGAALVDVEEKKQSRAKDSKK